MRKGFSARKMKRKVSPRLLRNIERKKLNKVWKLERVRDRLLEIVGGWTGGLDEKDVDG